MTESWEVSKTNLTFQKKKPLSKFAERFQKRKKASISLPIFQLKSLKIIIKILGMSKVDWCQLLVKGRFFSEGAGRFFLFLKMPFM